MPTDGRVQWSLGEVYATSNDFVVRSRGSSTGNDFFLQTNAGGTAKDGIIIRNNFAVELYYNDVKKFETQDQTAADATSGAEVVDGDGNLRNVGFNEAVEDANSSTGTITPFGQNNVGQVIYWTGGTATNMDTFANTGGSQTNIPAGAVWTVQNNGAGALTFRGGTSVTIRYWSGAGAAPADVDVTIARGGVATVRKVSDTVYDIWGVGLS
jgi:hypothetical protein